ncbi:B3/B4 domain-containing protein [Pseudoleptotrichia goodfellowii]|uniref:B3/4 domain protein n=1 Tax=Pseudoleptotrichia goodfellowii TaxID=157692 RepID=A0A510J991_9FUSO|nr:B3/4 domain-containing protein [Pseudoleptotrichia goodfellowii]BBM35757.1 B3/4 domain protein [Pseudoleptotrichia goodfellowii]
MSKFIVNESFWNIFPEANIGVLLLENIDNSKESSENIVKLLEESNKEAKKHLTEDQLSKNPVIAIWREAYQKFKTKKGVRCSIEALLKRVEKGSGVSTINPLVDIYNVASLKYGLPVGAEDIETFEGDLVLGVTEGNDEFYALGDEENSPTLEGEICYKDDKGAVCRCFNWRDGQRTMITEKTRKAFVVIEYVNGEKNEDIEKALEMIAEYTEKELGAKKVSLKILNKNEDRINLI